MVDSDHRYKQTSSVKNDRLNKSLAALITEERTQKLDLFIHLVANLKQSLIICGAKGIGKTTLLKVFKTNQAGIWPIVDVSATNGLSFDGLQEHLWRALKQQVVTKNTDQGLTYYLQQLARLNQKVILLIDDAGNLADGLMTKLMQFATTNPSLRLVFALRNNELVLKRTTERAIGDCHFIELPPLSNSQCNRYVLALVNQEKNLSNSLNELGGGNRELLSEVLLKRIYTKTRGNPGKIVEELPNFLNANAMKGSNWIYMLVFACSITAGVVVLLWKSLTVQTETETGQALALEDSGKKSLTLAIPGQVVQSKKLENTTSYIQKPISRTPMIPESNNNKLDYYPGFARVRDKDALDEFQPEKNITSNQTQTPEHPSVEIITPESTAGNPTKLEVPEKILFDAAKSAIPVNPISQSVSTKPSQVAELKSGDKNSISKVAPTNLKESNLSKNAAKNESPKRVIPELKTLTPLKNSSLINNSTQGMGIETLEKPLINSTQDNQAALAKSTKPIESENKNAPLTSVQPKLPESAKLKQDDVDSGPDGQEHKTPEKNKVKVTDSTQKLKESKTVPKFGVVMKYQSEELKSKKTDVSNTAQDKEVQPLSVPEAVESPTKSTVKSPKVNVDSLASTNKTSSSAFTLQAMVFSQQETLKNFMRKHANLAPVLQYKTIRNEAGEKYVVTYGAFSSLAEANAAKKKLPADFSQAYARKK